MTAIIRPAAALCLLIIISLAGACTVPVTTEGQRVPGEPKPLPDSYQAIRDAQARHTPGDHASKPEKLAIALGPVVVKRQAYVLYAAKPGDSSQALMSDEGGLRFLELGDYDEVARALVMQGMMKSPRVKLLLPKGADMRSLMQGLHPHQELWEQGADYLLSGGLARPDTAGADQFLVVLNLWETDGKKLVCSTRGNGMGMEEAVDNAVKAMLDQVTKRFGGR